MRIEVEGSTICIGCQSYGEPPDGEPRTVYLHCDMGENLNIHDANAIPVARYLFTISGTTTPLGGCSGLIRVVWMLCRMCCQEC